MTAGLLLPYRDHDKVGDQQADGEDAAGRGQGLPLNTDPAGSGVINIEVPPTKGALLSFSRAL